MKKRLCAVVGLFFWMNAAAFAEPGLRPLNTFSDHESSGMELLAPDVHAIDVPAYTLVSITVQRISGSCELRVKAGTGYREGPTEWLPVVSGVQGQLSSPVDTAKVMVLPPSSEAERVYVIFEATGKGHCGYRSYIKQANLPAAAAKGFAKTAVQLMIEHVAAKLMGVEPGDLAKNPMAERGIQAAISLFTSDDITDFTFAMLMNEIQIRVTRAVPDSHVLAAWVTNTFQDVASDLYGPYFGAKIN
jgi:hypothetical protein